MMTLEDELDRRKWPRPPFEMGPPPSSADRREWLRRLAVSDYERSVYVSEGRIVLRHLGWKGVVKAIPPGESAVTSLAVDPKGRVVGLTSGAKSHMFIYDPQVDRVVDLFTIDQDSLAKNSLVVCPDGKVFAATRRSGGERGPGRLITLSLSYGETLTWEPAKPQVTEIELPRRDEGISCLAHDESRGLLYGLTSETGSLFCMETDSGKAHIAGQVDELGEFSDCLAVGIDGTVYGGKRWGGLFAYRHEQGELGELGLRIPSLAGRDLYNRVDSMAVDTVTGRIYGGGTADGVLFMFDPKEGRMVSLGKPTFQPRTRAIAIGRDRKVYGISGRRGGCGHLFRYDLSTGDLRDLGIPLAHSDQFWHGYEFDSMVTGRGGEIYLGESDRISHLFIYYPPH